MEWSSNADTSFSSLDPTSSKEEDLFSTSLISSTPSDVDIAKPHAWEVSDFTTHLYIPNPPCSSPKMYVPLPERVNTCRKSKILPSSLLLSVTKKVRDGTVSKAEISPNELKPYPIPAAGSSKVDDESSSYKLLSKTPPPPVNSCIKENPTIHFLDSNIISNVECNSSPLTFFLKAELNGDVQEDKLGTSVNSETSICTIYSDDETRNKLRTERPTRSVPNYFISIQFSDPDIYSSLKEVHRSVMKRNGNCSLAAVPLHSLHMTLAVMRLDSEEDMARAKAALNRCGDELRPKYRHELLELPLQGLGNFRHSVVFAKVHPGEHVSRLEEIAAVVQRKFCEEGLVDNKHDFTPHVTVLKLSRVGKKLTKKTGLKKIYPDIYEEFVDSYFGTQKVRDLQLCSMLKAKDISGYYQVEHKIEFGVDDDEGTAMSVVNEGSKKDSSTLTPAPVDSTTNQSNPEPTMSKNSGDISTNKVSCEEKIEFDPAIPKEALNKDYTSSYKSEMFIQITGQEDNHALHPEKLSMLQEQTEANLIDKESINTPQKTVPDANFSSVVINLPINIPPAPINKQVSDSKFTSVAMYFPGNVPPNNKLVSENIPLSDKPVSDSHFSSVSINLSENIPPSNNPVSDGNFVPVSTKLSENIPPSNNPVSDGSFSSVSTKLSENIPPSNNPVSDGNFVPVSTKLSENIPPSNNPVSDGSFSSVSTKLSENIPPSNNPVSDANFSSVSINLSENIPTSDKPISDNGYTVVTNLSEKIPPNDKPVRDNVSSVMIHFPAGVLTSDKILSEANISSTRLNLPENIPQCGQVVSGADFISRAVNLSDNVSASDRPDLEMRPAGEIFGKKILENNEADVADYFASSSDDVPLPEAVSARTNWYSDEVVPTPIVNQAEGIVEESSTPDIINVNDSGVNSKLRHLEENSPSSSMIVPMTVTPQTPGFNGNASVTDVSAMVEETASVQDFQISSPSLNDFEFAEEATEGLSGWDDPAADDLIQSETADVCSIGSKTSDGNSLNAVASRPKKRRKMEKCSVM